MTATRHHVIIGSGSAGFGAAMTLRARDRDARITMITMSRLPFYNRYDLPRIFRGSRDWRSLLAVPPETYERQDICLRRASRVVDVDGKAGLVKLAHNEDIAYDSLLVCAGGRAYLPEALADYDDLMHGFASFEAAMQMQADLPEGGTVVMLGGDMIGLDLALTLAETGHRVTLVPTDQIFWPHSVAPGDRGPFLEALERSGIRVVAEGAPVRVEKGEDGKPARRVVLESGEAVTGDVVMAFCGLVPSVEFMLGAGVDIERGLLVDPHLRTSNERIWAAGDVCQIWSDADKVYKFYHGWRNVRVMGELAARNVTGGSEVFEASTENGLTVDEAGRLRSTFWDH